MDTPTPDWAALRAWKETNHAVGVLFTPGDLETIWDELREDNPGLPEFADIRDEAFETWAWRKGIAEQLTVLGLEIIEDALEAVAQRYYE